MAFSGQHLLLLVLGLVCAAMAVVDSCGDTLQCAQQAVESSELFNEGVHDFDRDVDASVSKVSLLQRAQRPPGPSRSLPDLQRKRAVLLEELRDVHMALASTERGNQSQDWPWSNPAPPPPSCTGSGSPKLRVCYVGTGGIFMLGEETLSAYFKSYQAGAGTGNGDGYLNLRGHGYGDIRCDNRYYSASEQDLTIDFGSCLPGGVEIQQARYCPDQDHLEVSVKITAVGSTASATLKPAPCS